MPGNVEWRRKNPERAKVLQRRYAEKHREKINAYKQRWREANPEKQREYYLRNKASHRDTVKRWCEKNKDRLRDANRRWRQANKEKLREYKRRALAKLRGTVQYEVECFARQQVSQAVNRARGRFKKTRSSLEYLGCSTEFFRGWIERQFKHGMTWENWGSVWHVDHIIPVCTVRDTPTDDHVRLLLHYTNLRPLYVHENLKKQGNELPYVQPELPICLGI